MVSEPGQGHEGVHTEGLAKRWMLEPMEDEEGAHVDRCSL